MPKNIPAQRLVDAHILRRDLLREIPLRLPTTAAYSSTLLGLNMTSSASHGQTSLRTNLYITLPCRQSRLRAAKLEFGKSSCLGLAFVRWHETKVLNLSPPFWALWDSTHLESDKANWLNPDGSSSCRTVIPATCSLGASYTRYYLDLDNA